MESEPEGRASSLSVGYVLTRYPVLSETFVRLEIEELRRRGVRVSVVSAYAGDEAADDVMYVYGQGRPKWRLALEHLRWAARSPRRYLSFLAVARAAGEERGDVLVRHLPWAATQLRRAGTQVLHAHFAWSAAARAWALAELMGLPWSMTVHAHDMFGRPYRLNEKLHAAGAVVTVCRYNDKHLREDYGFLGPVDLVVCGVHVPEPLPPRIPQVDVLAVGRLVEKKGFDLLVAAAAELPPGARVQIAGEGPERAALEEAIARTSSPVVLLGAVPHEQVLEMMSRARVLCLPARIASNGDRDSMPLVVKEAMARSVPVVATSVVAIPEMLDEGCGWLVAPEDPAGLASALRHALGDAAEAQRRGAAGRIRVATEFTIEAEVAKLEGVFLRLAS